ncbi:pimeloyl-ACP methyl ester carboxylesterase [Paraburkholderia sp. GAS448]|uniref:alpha/beta fold hydrolase n=1 Tax=Paraburkholderia sp. GAS448 TaxID=3035136 RepID=UPI003D1BF64A
MSDAVLREGSVHIERATGAGSVSGVPELPDGFAQTFESCYIDVGGLRLHAVIGGGGPPLLLVCGWPQTWYAWRYVMPRLAQQFTVIAVEPRGVGLSEKAPTGYDSDTLATDLLGVMTVLGHERFALVGFNIGNWTGYAMAAARPDRIERWVMVESIFPGVTPSPPVFDVRQLSDNLWHVGFNRAYGINERMVQGREDIYFGHQFASKAGSPNAIPDYAVEVYVDAVTNSEALRASFEYYRAIDVNMERNKERVKARLPMPILAVGASRALGEYVEHTARLIADNVAGLVIADCGHFIPEEAPGAFLEAIEPFLLPLDSHWRLKGN